MVIASIWPALHDPDVYAAPDVFFPDRWLRGTDSLNNWLVFGSGAHVCLGQTFTLLYLTLLLGTAALGVNWSHQKTADSEKMKLTPCILPQVSLPDIKDQAKCS